jgi:L-lactate dehydrogenase complex protein LldG
MSRETILKAVREACVRTGATTDREKAFQRRLAHPARHPLPMRLPAGAAELEARFTALLSGQGAEIVAVPNPRGLPTAIAGYLRRHGLPMRLRSGDDPYLNGLPWQDTPDVARDTGAARASDTAGLSRAIAGVAETGTLALVSGPANPVTLGFLPETHLVVLRAATIVATFEDAQALLLASERALPRTVNLVSGASRTGDIGGRIVMGAHGPRRLAVFLVTDE